MSPKPLSSLVFIIGAPRTGSTILFQSITATLPVTYTTNLACTSYRLMPMIMKCSTLLGKHVSHHYFSSHFGTTKGGGLFSPSECGKFWYQWFPKTPHYLTRTSLSEKKKHHLKKTINKIREQQPHKPLIFKNLPMGQRLDLIATLWPDAKFIITDRDTDQTMDSILRARKTLGIPPDGRWSVQPAESQMLPTLEEIPHVATQIWGIKKQIIDDLPQLFKKDQYMVVHYTEFTKQPQQVLNTICQFIGCYSNKKTELPVAAIHPSHKNSYPESYYKAIKLLDWNEANYEVL